MIARYTTTDGKLFTIAEPPRIDPDLLQTVRDAHALLARRGNMTEARQVLEGALRKHNRNYFLKGVAQ